MIASREWHLDGLMHGQLHELMLKMPSVDRRLATIDKPRIQRFMWGIVSSFLCRRINIGKAYKLARPFQGPYRVIALFENATPIDKLGAAVIQVAINRVRRCPRENPDTGEQASVERSFMDVTNGVVQQAMKSTDKPTQTHGGP